MICSSVLVLEYAVLFTMANDNKTTTTTTTTTTQSFNTVVFLAFPMFIVSWASSVSGHLSLSPLVAAYESLTVLANGQLRLRTPFSPSEGVRFKNTNRVITNWTRNQIEKAWKLSKYTHTFCVDKREYKYINLGTPRLDFRRSRESGLRSSPKRLGAPRRDFGKERGLLSRTAAGNRA